MKKPAASSENQSEKKRNRQPARRTEENNHKSWKGIPFSKQDGAPDHRDIWALLQESDKTLQAPLLASLQNRIGNRSIQKLVNSETRNDQDLDNDVPLTIRGEDQNNKYLIQRQKAPSELLSGVREETGPEGNKVTVPIETPKLGANENPSYEKAQIYIDLFFRSQTEIARILMQMKRDGLDAFNKRSSSTYNSDSNTALELFEAALALVPLAAPLYSGFKFITGVSLESEKWKKFLSFGKRAVSVSETTEKFKGAAEKVGQVGAKGEEASEEKNRIEFELQTIRTLGQYEARESGTRIMLERSLRYRLLELRNLSPEYDLEREVINFLGPLPPAEGLEKIAAETAQQFEILLYKDYYIDENRLQKIEVDSQDKMVFLDKMPKSVANLISEQSAWPLMTKDKPILVDWLIWTERITLHHYFTVKFDASTATGIIELNGVKVKI